jgi:hypothetical protein
MTAIKVHLHAGTDKRFAPTAFDKQIGKQIRLTDLTGCVTAAKAGRVFAAEVAEDGRYVTLTIDVDDAI